MYLPNFFSPFYFPGTSKGYGLVKYESKASSIQARHVLEGHTVRDGHVLDCDWLKHNPSKPGPQGSNVTSLHSKCLYVDQLPPDYRDMAQFRRLFSKIVNPPYCQVWRISPKIPLKELKNSSKKSAVSNCFSYVNDLVFSWYFSVQLIFKFSAEQPMRTWWGR